MSLYLRAGFVSNVVSPSPTIIKLTVSGSLDAFLDVIARYSRYVAGGACFELVDRIDDGDAHRFTGRVIDEDGAAADIPAVLSVLVAANHGDGRTTVVLMCDFETMDATGWFAYLLRIVAGVWDEIAPAVGAHLFYWSRPASERRLLYDQGWRTEDPTLVLARLLEPMVVRLDAFGVRLDAPGESAIRPEEFTTENIERLLKRMKPHSRGRILRMIDVYQARGAGQTRSAIAHRWDRTLRVIDEDIAILKRFKLDPDRRSDAR